MAAQAELVTTFEPSRLRTVSRVLQVPLMVIQWLNRSRLYPVRSSVATVRLAR